MFEDLYGIKPEELNDFAIACCQQQIEGVYGERSWEKVRYVREIEQIGEEKAPDP